MLGLKIRTPKPKPVDPALTRVKNIMALTEKPKVLAVGIGSPRAAPRSASPLPQRMVVDQDLENLLRLDLEARSRRYATMMTRGSPVLETTTARPRSRVGPSPLRRKIKGGRRKVSRRYKRSRK